MMRLRTASSLLSPRADWHVPALIIRSAGFWLHGGVADSKRPNDVHLLGRPSLSRSRKGNAGMKRAHRLQHRAYDPAPLSDPEALWLLLIASCGSQPSSSPSSILR